MMVKRAVKKTAKKDVSNQLVLVLLVLFVLVSVVGLGVVLSSDSQSAQIGEPLAEADPDNVAKGAVSLEIQSPPSPNPDNKVVEGEVSIRITEPPQQ